MLTSYAPLVQPPLLLRAVRAIPEHDIPEGAVIVVSQDGRIRRVHWEAPEASELLKALDAGALEMVTPGADARQRLAAAASRPLYHPEAIRWPSDRLEAPPLPPSSPGEADVRAAPLRLLR